MQSVGMRSVGRFFRNATKTQKKVLKKAPKKVLSLKKERMEIVYPNIEEKKKTLAESATKKNDVRHCWNKKALVA